MLSSAILISGELTPASANAAFCAGDAVFSGLLKSRGAFPGDPGGDGSGPDCFGEPGDFLRAGDGGEPRAAIEATIPSTAVAASSGDISSSTTVV